MQKVVGAVPGRSRNRDALRRCAVPARAAPWHPRRERPQRSPAPSACSKSMLARDVHHPGACHLYVHATESTVVPGSSGGMCRVPWPQSIPGASHINHMPSHTWNEVGRWGDSVRANLEAWHSDLKAAIGEGFAIYPEHNLHMLLYAASMDGQGAIAMRAGKDYTKLHRRVVLRGADADSVRPLRRGAGGHQSADARSRAGSGTSRRATPTEAGTRRLRQLYLGRVQEDGRDHRGGVPRRTRQSVLLGSLAGILEGEIQRTDGDLPGAIARSSRPSSCRKRSSTTSRSRCPFPRATGSAPRSSTRSVSRGRDGVSRRAEGSSAQRLVAARTAAGAGGQGKGLVRRLGRPGVELVALGHLDPIVAILSGVRDVPLQKIASGFTG